MKIAIAATTSNREAATAIRYVTGLTLEDVADRLAHGAVLIEAELLSNPEMRRRCRELLVVLGHFKIEPAIYRLPCNAKPMLLPTGGERVPVSLIERMLAHWKIATIPQR